MSLYPCPECGHKISQYATQCPECGTGIVRGWSEYDGTEKIGWGCCWVVVAVMVLIGLNFFMK